MSSINGDKARFQRDRKAKIARRTSKRKFLLELKEQPKSTPATRPAKASL